MAQSRYVVFHGDADGICAAHQHFLHHRLESTLITGVKRDLNLLKQIQNAESSEIFVFDIPVRNNLSDLDRLLSAGCRIYWVDHHVSNDIPNHEKLKVTLNTDPNINASYLVANATESLSFWTVVGLFGDNMNQMAAHIAQSLSCAPDKLLELKDLGQLLNYNGYGDTVDDLYFHPSKILRKLREYDNPFDLLDRSEMIAILREGFLADSKNADRIGENTSGIYILPDEKWSRRIIGSFANRKATAEPEKAHAVLVEDREKGGYTVSIRAALNSTKNVALFCERFPTGGGRLEAGGINFLSNEKMDEFMAEFRHYFN